MQELLTLTPGMLIPFGGNNVTVVPDELASAFEAGDRLVVVQSNGDLLHIPKQDWDVASGAVDRAHAAFKNMGDISDDAISAFFLAFADNLEDPAAFASIERANQSDIEAAKQKGRSTTRLVLSPSMRQEMIDGLRSWAAQPSGRDAVVETVEHDGWTARSLRSGLGVVGFVFEGRPNVFADACGVIRSGNTVVFRIGSDALGTARAIVEHALDPALRAAGLPDGAASLVSSPSRGTGYAMFSNTKLALAVARGTGTAVAQLGAVARQAGVAVSLHGTGGAWIFAGRHVDPSKLGHAVEASLDRKVCNTLNTCCLLRETAAETLPVFLSALQNAGQKLGVNPKLHVLADQMDEIPESWRGDVTIGRAEGEMVERQTSTLERHQLGDEWEWETSPEVSLAIVDSIDEAVSLFNTYSPHFVASMITEDTDEHDRFYNLIDAPFVGNGFTRWVDGQYAFNRPELGLSNWENGRLFARGGVLSGSSVFTVRVRVDQTDPTVSR